MKHKLNFLLTGIIVLSALTVLVTAAPTTTPRATASGAGNSDKCAQVGVSVDTLENRYTSNMNTWTNRYRNMSDSLQALQVRLQQKGYDTETLEEDLTSLNGYLEDFNQVQNSFMEQLRQLKQYACDEEGVGGQQYRATMTGSKEKLADIRGISQSAYQLLKGDIKQDLEDIKGQTPTTVGD